MNRGKKLVQLAINNKRDADRLTSLNYPVYETTKGSGIKDRKDLSRLAKSVGLEQNQIYFQEQEYEEPVTSGSEYCPSDNKFSDTSVVSETSCSTRDSFEELSTAFAQSPDHSLMELSNNAVGVPENKSMEFFPPTNPICLNNTDNSSEIPIIDTLVFTSSEPLNTTEKENRIRRKHNCLFCYEEVGNFSRHLVRNHNDELIVQEFLKLPPKSAKRKKLIDKIRREGDFCTSNVVPVMKGPKENFTDYITCKFCKGYYSRKCLRKHAKKCYFNPDPTKRFNAQSEGHTIMSGNFGPYDILTTSGLLSLLRADEVSLTAKRDPIICEVARRYIKSHKEKHLLLVAKRKMRRLSRLLIASRNLKKNNTLMVLDILKPDMFKTLIAASKEISGYDVQSRTFKSPSLGLQIGTLIKNAIDCAHSCEIQKVDSSHERLEQLKNLKVLLETDWSHEISSEAGQNIAINKFNKPTAIPMAEDIAKFDKYLKDLLQQSKHKLIENSKDIKAYRILQEAIFCIVLIFNKRRVGELQRINLLSFMKHYRSPPALSEFENALTESEKILYKSLRRVVIRGKRGRGVPVLFTEEVIESIEYMLGLRSNFALHENTYLFGIPGTDNPIAGNAVMRKHAKLAFGDGNKASLLTSTKLRKHLATIAQILKMDKNELEQLAGFLGHTEKTHSQFYRLPDNIYQTAKVSKILLLSKSGSIDKYKGKSLDDIQIDDTIVEDDNCSDEEPLNDDEITELLENNNIEQESVPIPSTSHVSNDNEQKKSRGKGIVKRVRWTNEQKKIANEYFKHHIKTKTPAKKEEVLELIARHPNVFENKSWKVIKVYVQNMYSKRK